MIATQAEVATTDLSTRGSRNSPRCTTAGPPVRLPVVGLLAAVAAAGAPRAHAQDLLIGDGRGPSVFIEWTKSGDQYRYALSSTYTTDVRVCFNIHRTFRDDPATVPAGLTLHPGRNANQGGWSVFADQKPTVTDAERCDELNSPPGRTNSRGTAVQDFSPRAPAPSASPSPTPSPAPSSAQQAINKLLGQFQQMQAERAAAQTRDRVSRHSQQQRYQEAAARWRELRVMRAAMMADPEVRSWGLDPRTGSLGRYDDIDQRIAVYEGADAVLASMKLESDAERFEAFLGDLRSFYGWKLTMDTDPEAIKARGMARSLAASEAQDPAVRDSLLREACQISRDECGSVAQGSTGQAAVATTGSANARLPAAAGQLLWAGSWSGRLSSTASGVEFRVEIQPSGAASGSFPGSEFVVSGTATDQGLVDLRDPASDRFVRLQLRPSGEDQASADGECRGNIETYRCSGTFTRVRALSPSPRPMPSGLPANVVVGADGMWYPAQGYEWTTPAQPSQSQYAVRLKTPPNVVRTADGQLVPAPGNEWVAPNDPDSRAVRRPSGGAAPTPGARSRHGLVVGDFYPGLSSGMSPAEAATYFQPNGDWKLTWDKLREEPKWGESVVSRDFKKMAVLPDEALFGRCRLSDAFLVLRFVPDAGLSSIQFLLGRCAEGPAIVREFVAKYGLVAGGDQTVFLAKWGRFTATASLANAYDGTPWITLTAPREP